eukprot:5500216-Prorocentrum_lima.AAC.1
MTSSLVGSEMCIRDRTFISVADTAIFWSCVSALKRTWLKPQVAVYGAVSYTHLTLPTICSV